MLTTGLATCLQPQNCRKQKFGLFIVAVVLLPSTIVLQCFTSYASLTSVTRSARNERGTHKPMPVNSETKKRCKGAQFLTLQNCELPVLKLFIFNPRNLLKLLNEISYWEQLMFETPHYVAEIYQKKEDLRVLRENVLLVVRDYNRLATFYFLRFMLCGSVCLGISATTKHNFINLKKCECNRLYIQHHKRAKSLIPAFITCAYAR